MTNLISVLEMNTKKIVGIFDVAVVPRIGELIRLMDLESEGTDVTDYRIIDIEWMVAKMGKDRFHVAECRVKVEREKNINIKRDVLGHKDNDGPAMVH